MKVELLALVALWLVVVYTYASPVRVETSEKGSKVIALTPSAIAKTAEGTEGRQARQQPAAPAAEDDDDDDDDDDDLDVLDDDDDDDDDDDASPAAAADDDDDEDDDYFGGIFDDILGGKFSLFGHTTSDNFIKHNTVYIMKFFLLLTARYVKYF